MSIKAYTRTLKNTEEPRQIERRLIARATATLEAYRDGYDQADKTGRALMLTPEMKSALWQNQQIWLALKSDLALPDNSLEPQLRAGLLSLAIWVGRQTQAVLGGGGRIAPLIEINQNVLAGLEAEGHPSPALAEGA